MIHRYAVAPVKIAIRPQWYHSSGLGGVRNTLKKK
jgi:hypothetical protein